MNRIRTAALALAAGSAVLASSLAPAQAFAGQSSTPGGTRYSSQAFNLEGHRGARGLRPENTLSAFAFALQTGVTTLELDTGVTKDGVVVVTHERRLSSLECRDTAPAFPNDPLYPYVGDPSKLSDGKLIKDLTLAQIKTLDCGTRKPLDPSTDAFIGTQTALPGSRMPTLDEVFQLAERYEADQVQFDIETKLDPTVADTVDPTTFATAVIDVIREHKAISRSYLQSFDWRTLQVARSVAPTLRRVALAQAPTIFPGTPWTGGIPITSTTPFDGELVTAAAQLGAHAVSVRFPDITDALIARTHEAGMKIVPWTVNNPADMDALIERGVDGLITDYPDRARTVMAANKIRLPRQVAAPAFDVEAHRGGMAYYPENTLAAFRHALDLGVSTLELDTGVTKDGVLVVSHERRISTVECQDTGSNQFVGQLVKDLTLAQIKTLDCGLNNRYPATQQRVVGEQMPTLQEVFDLVKSRNNRTVRFNIETKISPDVVDTVAYDVFTRTLVRQIERNRLVGRAMIQSFDWRTIMLAEQLNPKIDTVGLIWQFAKPDCSTPADECSLQAVVGDATVASTWTNGVNWWKYRDLAKLAKKAKIDVISGNWQIHDPYQRQMSAGEYAAAGYYAKEDPSMFYGPTLQVLREKGLPAVPYTVNDQAIMQRLIDLGISGIISDDPVLLLKVARLNGLA